MTRELTVPNQTPARTVQVACLCKGRNSRCVMCGGSGELTKRSCIRCGGVGKQGGAACVDCRGDGWRSIDQPEPM